MRCAVLPLLAIACLHRFFACLHRDMPGEWKEAEREKGAGALFACTRTAHARVRARIARAQAHTCTREDTRRRAHKRTRAHARKAFFVMLRLHASCVTDVHNVGDGE